MLAFNAVNVLSTGIVLYCTGVGSDLVLGEVRGLSVDGRQHCELK